MNICGVNDQYIIQLLKDPNYRINLDNYSIETNINRNGSGFIPDKWRTISRLKKQHKIIQFTHTKGDRSTRRRVDLYLHRILYYFYNGKIDGEKVVCFMDGDFNNYSKENLVQLSKEHHTRLQILLGQRNVITNFKITRNIAEEVRDSIAFGIKTYKETAIRFKISKATVHDIVYRRTWNK